MPRPPTLLALAFWVAIVAFAVGVPMRQSREVTRAWETNRATGERPAAPPAVSGETRPMQERGRL